LLSSESFGLLLVGQPSSEEKMSITFEEIQSKYAEYHQKEVEASNAKILRDREAAIPEIEKIFEQCLDAAVCGNTYVDFAKASISDIVPTILREKGLRWEVLFDVITDRFVYRISGWGSNK
jgi:hypothetical protein